MLLVIANESWVRVLWKNKVARMGYCIDNRAKQLCVSSQWGASPFTPLADDTPSFF
jgi:hypothetical protein